MQESMRKWLKDGGKVEKKTLTSLERKKEMIKKETPKINAKSCRKKRNRKKGRVPT